MALKYDWDVVIPALEKAQNVLCYAKGDCRNIRAIDFLDDCINSMNTWIENAKPREEEPVINSRKPIKSSLEDRLLPYLEEFEEGYSNALTEDPMDSFAGFDTTDARCETFYETFKSDHNLTDDDINKLENAVLDMWHEAEINAMDFNTYNAVDLAFPELDAKAKNIITRWYEAEDAIDDFDSTEEFAEYIKSDIYAMLDAAAGDERKFVDKALKKSGYAH